MSLSKCNSYTDEEGRELLVHGNHLFPIASYDDNTGKHELHAGEGFYFGPGVMHSVDPSPTATEECRLHSIVFNPMIVSGNSESIFHLKYVQPILEDPFYEFLLLRDDEGKEIMSYIENAWKLHTLEPAGFELDVRYQLSCLLRVLGQISHSNDTNSERNIRGKVRMKAMVSYLHLHYHENITLGDIAASANISESEVLREFNTYMGITPIKYLIQYRIQMATMLLTTTDTKIAEICNQCGFTDISYFTKVFRELKGMPPAKYRKSFQQ